MKATRTAQLNGELRDQRLLLQARALSDLGRYDLAEEVIQDIKTHEATRLRADILWAGHRWEKAAEQIELLYGKRWRDFRPLDARERFDILRAAIGYALGNDAIGLQRFREKYAAKMHGGPDGHAFDVVSAPIGTSNTEFQAVASRIAGVGTLDAFLSDMRKRYPNSGALSLKGGTGGKAAPKVSPPDTVPSADAKSSENTPDKAPAGAPKPGAAGSSALRAPTKPKSAVSPTPPTVPQGVPLVPDAAPTGSIGRR